MRSTKNLFEFRRSYSPKNAEYYAYQKVDPEEQKLIDNFVTREELDKKLKSSPGISNVFYEILSAAAKLKGGIVSFGTKLKGLFERVKKGH